MRYGLQKFFGSQNSCGRAQTGPARVQTHAACALTDPALAQSHAGRSQTASKSQKTLDGHISLKMCPNWAF